MMKNNKEGYRGKICRNKKNKFINRKGRLPRMKWLPKLHKEVMSLRPI